jgi:hypothetical protein
VSVECYNWCLEDCKLSYIEADARFIICVHAALVLSPICIPEKVVSKSKMISKPKETHVSKAENPGKKYNNYKENIICVWQSFLLDKKIAK